MDSASRSSTLFALKPVGSIPETDLAIRKVLYTYLAINYSGIPNDRVPTSGGRSACGKGVVQQ